MCCFKLHGLFVGLLTSAALANPVNIPKHNISSRDNGNGFPYHLPTLPEITALPTNVQERGLLDHLPTLADPVRMPPNIPTLLPKNKSMLRRKGLRGPRIQRFALEVSVIIATVLSLCQFFLTGLLKLLRLLLRPPPVSPMGLCHYPMGRQDLHLLTTHSIPETEAYSAYMASATEHCNTTLSGPSHRTSFTETIQSAPSTTTEASVSRGNWGPSLSSSFSHHVSAPTITQGLLNIATVTGTGVPSSMMTHAPRMANAEHCTTTSTSYSSFLAPFSSYPGCTYTRWGQMAPMQNGPVKIEWYSTTTETVYGNCYGCDYTFHDVRPNGYGATGDNGKRFTTTIYSHSIVTVLTPTCVPTPWPTWWTNAEA